MGDHLPPLRLFRRFQLMPYQLTGNPEGYDRPTLGVGNIVCPRHKWSNFVWKQMEKWETRQRAGPGDPGVPDSDVFLPRVSHLHLLRNGGSQRGGVCSQISPSWTPSLQDLFWLSMKSQTIFWLCHIHSGEKVHCTSSVYDLIFS